MTQTRRRLTGARCTVVATLVIAAIVLATGNPALAHTGSGSGDGEWTFDPEQSDTFFCATSEYTYVGTFNDATFTSGSTTGTFDVTITVEGVLHENPVGTWTDETCTVADVAGSPIGNPDSVQSVSFSATGNVSGDTLSCASFDPTVGTGTPPATTVTGSTVRRNGGQFTVDLQNADCDMTVGGTSANDTVDHTDFRISAVLGQGSCAGAPPTECDTTDSLTVTQT